MRRFKHWDTVRDPYIRIQSHVDGELPCTHLWVPMGDMDKDEEGYNVPRAGQMFEHDGIWGYAFKDIQVDTQEEVGLRPINGSLSIGHSITENPKRGLYTVIVSRDGAGRLAGILLEPFIKATNND